MNMAFRCGVKCLVLVLLHLNLTNQFCVSQDDPRPALEKVSFSVNTGELLMIYGEVGSGKVNHLVFFISKFDNHLAIQHV